ncbi:MULTISPECIES: DUF3306 domain-containing protein [Ralstonia solanacearum species complex]|uniref:DUF3306 domain-containing protein n=1 Tax=Ralstonia solanacearum species complex TaxID=3116862 RepID=UPI00078E9C02|nr:DUF3306 domain-containing protein [Ralstonia solanacearum]BEU71396.1 hypothetical protein MAFF211271_09510 [Ralstonia pseudosolanacearum]AMP36913.1 hypothetical protein LBM2029_04870 [Ralstonia solanacearum]AXV76356.1 DUF3306 domain-containing protein [Ralstonia solanacearum]AXV85722.1 DUF3306 domain-containing protein [Ralstonia solanacearum]AXV90366.1 DUF3306 domain-containing protein [Ralstonia solanacearum]
MSELSFLFRWSRRKAADRRGEPEPEPAPPADVPAAGVVAPAPVAAAEPVPDAPPPPTLEDAAKLTPADDFAPFIARGVDEAVKRAALKKLFADPHFNVMDGLDTYIDDYSQPDPIPPEMLRELRQAAELRLFEPLDEAGAEPVGSEPATVPEALGAATGEAPPVQPPERPAPDASAQATPHSDDKPPSVE